MASYRTGGRAGIGAQFEFAGKKVLHPFIIHNYHDQIDSLSANLQPKASAFNAERCRRAPATANAAGGHSAAISAAKSQTALEH